MTRPTPVPVPWANRLTKLLNQFHAVHGGDRFPVDVEMLVRQTPEQFQTGEPIEIQGQAMDPEFEGALFNLNAGQPGKASWAIIYNQAISSPGRIRFTLAHELGHYLLHRQLQETFNCSEADMLHWDRTERKMESEADLFASYLLMPIDDFRSQVASTTVDLDVLGGCADLYGVSLTAAMLKWLEFTSKRAVLVMSRDGVVQCGRAAANRANGCPSPSTKNCRTDSDAASRCNAPPCYIPIRMWIATALKLTRESGFPANRRA